MPVRDCLRDREAKSGAARRAVAPAVRAREAVEKVRKRGGVNAGAGIFHRYKCARILAPYCQGDRTVLRRIADRVLNEVAHEAFQITGNPIDRRRACRERQRVTARTNERLKLRRDQRRDSAEVNNGGRRWCRLVITREQEQVRELVQKELDRANSNYAQVEQVKKFSILDHDLSVESGELTPTLKVKRNVINERYEDLFASMYG